MSLELGILGTRFRFAPHLGLFEPGPGLFHHSAGRGPVAQIEFAADHGFNAVQDNFLQLRDVREQERIGQTLARRGMTMGSFVATMIFDQPTFASEVPERIDTIIRAVKSAIEAANRVNGRWLTLIPGQRLAGVPEERQRSAIIGNLKRCVALAEAADVILLLEALNSRDRPGMALSNIVDAAAVVRAVCHPACRLVFDTYHVQVESGDLIDKIDRCWDEIGYIQLGDAPGRCEPGTGLIDFPLVLGHIWNKGYRGLLDMEHHASATGVEGERAVLRAYSDLERATTALEA